MRKGAEKITFPAGGEFSKNLEKRKRRVAGKNQYEAFNLGFYQFSFYPAYLDGSLPSGYTLYSLSPKLSWSVLAEAFLI